MCGQHVVIVECLCVVYKVCKVYVGQCQWLVLKVGHSAGWTGLTLFELSERQTL